MITLITGNPGSGKSALVVSMLLDEFRDRVAYVCGIPQLLVPHVAWKYGDVERIHEGCEITEGGHTDPVHFDIGSVIVVDEVQKLWPVTGPSAKVPDAVKFLEVHRHFGVDLILLTQKPALLNKNVRSLVGRHIHIRDLSWGRYLYEWAECRENPIEKSSRGEAIRRRFKPSNEALLAYQSATAHVKPVRRTPTAIPVAVGSLCLALAGGAFALSRLSEKMEPQAAPAKAVAPAEASPVQPGAQDFVIDWAPIATPPQNPPQALPVPSPAELVQSGPGLKPQGDSDQEDAQALERALHPFGHVAACISSETSCSCFSEAVALKLPEELCRDLIREGWSRPEPKPPDKSAR